jgi:hypothetical protein
LCRGHDQLVTVRSLDHHMQRGVDTVRLEPRRSVNCPSLNSPALGGRTFYWSPAFNMLALWVERRKKSKSRARYPWELWYDQFSAVSYLFALCINRSGWAAWLGWHWLHRRSRVRFLWKAYFCLFVARRKGY